jgi:hypothetical protein
MPRPSDGVCIRWAVHLPGCPVGGDVLWSDLGLSRLAPQSDAQCSCFVVRSWMRPIFFVTENKRSDVEHPAIPQSVSSHCELLGVAPAMLIRPLQLW